MEVPADTLRAAFDAERFRADGHAAIDRLADYLARATSGSPAMPVLPAVPPEAMSARWPSQFPVEPRGGFDELLARTIADSNHLHHPRYVGHQVTSPLPLAALCELAAGLLNNAMAVYEMGPAATAMERAVIAWMATRLGWPTGADGVITSGGSLGNLTALLAARQAKTGAWATGANTGALAVLAADQAHYSIDRAVRIMGWGDGGVVPVPVDARFRLRADALADAKRAAEKQGRRVIAVIGSACSTATGAFDPLEAIADFCAANDLWFHVDGAHGASAAISARHRGLLAGVERADSVVWDAHKMLLMPALVTAVLFREGARSYDAFAQEASYLFDQAAWFDVGHRTVECTKLMMSLKLYAALSVCGTKMFEDYLDGTFALAERFAARIDAAADFELGVSPQCNIVCFRHRPAGMADQAALDARQARVRRAILDSGAFYLVQTRLPAGLFLRVTLINPLTSDADLDALLATVRSVP